MTIICGYCGKPFENLDNYKKKYCPDCQSSGKRYYNQYQERRKNDPVADTYTTYYKKLYSLYRSKKISKAEIDEWRKANKIKQQEIKREEISIEDFIHWCESTYNRMKTQNSKTDEKIVSIRMNDSLKSQIILKSDNNKMSLNDYIIGLINNDLSNKKPLYLKNLSADNIISIETIREAQKVLDFATNILKTQENPSI